MRPQRNGRPVSVHAVVPVRSVRGKTRLGNALSDAERVELVRAMAAHVIETLSTAPGIERVHVLTSEPDLAPRECSRIADRGAGLNEAIAEAARALRARGAQRMIIVHADLPFLTREEIQTLVLASEEDALVAAPDVAESGTNALGLSLSRTVATRFGPGSLIAHRRLAEDAHLSFRLVRSPGLAYDVDEPAQLERLIAGSDARYEFLRPPNRCR